MNITTFTDMLTKMSNRVPEKTFLYWIDKNKALTYGETDRVSSRMAGALAGLGVEKGDRVGIFAHNGLDYIVSMFGAWKLGAISCHINVLQAEDMVYFVQNATPKALIYTHDMFPLIDRNRDAMPSIKQYICMDGEQEGALDLNKLLSEAPSAPKTCVEGGDAAHLSYTSGSSGMPKGALLAHGPTVRATHYIAERMQLTSDGVTLGPTSPASSYGLVVNLLPSLHRGATVGLMSKWDAAMAWEDMEKRGVDYFPANPLVFSDFLHECRRRGRKPAKLRVAPSGGAPLPLDLKKAYGEEFDIFLVESYGQSELGGFVALGYPRKEKEERKAAIGPCLPDKEVCIMDESGREVPVGQAGEMCIRGGYMIGYWEMPEKTDEVLRDGWLHTGDMGKMDEDGYISMLGRWSERMVSDGKVIFPRSMEEALLRHPAVQYAAVIGKPDARAGELPKGVVSLYPGWQAGTEELLEHCRMDLGAAGAPAEIAIISEMPMTATGKIGRALLQRRERERKTANE